MSAIGRLVGHNGAVGTMATLNDGILATGSRDRLIKVNVLFIRFSNNLSLIITALRSVKIVI